MTRPAPLAAAAPDLVAAVAVQGHRHVSIARVVIGDAVLYQGDCLGVLPTLGRVDIVLSDPPYPNGAGHFDGDVEVARSCLAAFPCAHWLVFWDELERPPVPLPHVATHIWHRTNTNRPGNYEAIYEFHARGERRASRVLRHPVVYPGLTGCVEATGHPTQKPVSLMAELLAMRPSGETVIDPFMGSGSCGVACVGKRRFIGVERDPRWFEVACERIDAAYRQPSLFAEPAPKPQQAPLFAEAAE